uniref:C2H2-type domain-containing protein n=1 Tax=Monopterus albus TaxID=43700 RepID=A0A3Q3R7H3_MONAL
MNGPVYISFFQGQLESVLEQVVQLAVQEISKTVGSSLNALLLETAAKEQENRRLKLQLQSQDNRVLASANPSDGQGTEPGLSTDTRRLEQRGRVVDQLKSVMEQVLDFALRELTKIVEASFDDLLLEIIKMEREHQFLEERLRKKQLAGRGEDQRTSWCLPAALRMPGRTSFRAQCPKRRHEEMVNPEHPPVLSVSQDWVPILDKVFGQKWCSDIWEIKELPGRGGGEGGGGAGQGLGERGVEQVEPLSAPSVTLETSPSSLPPLDSSGRHGSHHSSASMLHRLLTLPSQLLEEDNEDAAIKETLATLATNGATHSCLSICLQKKRRRVWSECEECGRRFSRMSLLKAHRQTHISENPTDMPSSSFSSATRLHSHIRTQHPRNWP